MQLNHRAEYEHTHRRCSRSALCGHCGPWCFSWQHRMRNGFLDSRRFPWFGRMSSSSRCSCLLNPRWESNVKNRRFPTGCSYRGILFPIYTMGCQVCPIALRIRTQISVDTFQRVSCILCFLWHDFRVCLLHAMYHSTFKSYVTFFFLKSKTRTWMDGALDACCAGKNDPCSEQTVRLSRLGMDDVRVEIAIGWQHESVFFVTFHEFPGKMVILPTLCSPNEDFWKDEQKTKSGFSTDFSMVLSPNLLLTPLKSASFEIRISSFVPPSQLFVWEG